MGLFDLPAPFFTAVQDLLTRVFPVPVTLVLWAGLVAVVCMELYRLSSPQRHIANLKREVSSLQHELNDFDGEFDEAWPLLSRLLRLSFKRVALVIPATLISAYPVIAMFLWMSHSYGLRFPSENEPVAIAIEEPVEARWVNSSPPQLELWSPEHEMATTFPVMAPVSQMHKREWWQLFAANPAGYLPDHWPLERIALDLPRQELLPWGPSWLRGWEAIFLPALFIAALAYKTVRRIQ